MGGHLFLFSIFLAAEGMPATAATICLAEGGLDICESPIPCERDQRGGGGQSVTLARHHSLHLRVYSPQARFIC